MQVIFDECIPRPLMRELAGHAIATVQEQGWSGIVNGALLKRIGEAGFKAFITMDQSLPAQQNLQSLSFGIILLRARSNKLAVLEPLAPAILRSLTTLAPGEVVIVSAEPA